MLPALQFDNRTAGTNEDSLKASNSIGEGPTSKNSANASASLLTETLRAPDTCRDNSMPDDIKLSCWGGMTCFDCLQDSETRAATPTSHTPCHTADKNHL
jgi:hypothetical protein